MHTSRHAQRIPVTTAINVAIRRWRSKPSAHDCLTVAASSHGNGRGIAPIRRANWDTGRRKALHLTTATAFRNRKARAVLPGLFTFRFRTALRPGSGDYRCPFPFLV
jgi:hypothetical protein